MTKWGVGFGAMELDKWDRGISSISHEHKKKNSIETRSGFKYGDWLKLDLIVFFHKALHDSTVEKDND